jgi:hypothetical protein
MPGGGKPGHIDPDLSDDRSRGDRADTGDLIEMAAASANGASCVSIWTSTAAMSLSSASIRDNIRESKNR